MHVTFGDLVFEVLDYEEQFDTLTLRRGAWRDADDWDASREGDPITFTAGQLVGIELLTPCTRLDRGQPVTVTLGDGTVLTSPDLEDVLRPLRQAG
jgi:hypothetical protein